MGVDDFFFGRKTTTAKKKDIRKDFLWTNFFQPPKKRVQWLHMIAIFQSYLEATKTKKNTLKTISIHFTDGVNGMVYVRFILDHFPWWNEAKTHRDQKKITPCWSCSTSTVASVEVRCLSCVVSVSPPRKKWRKIAKTSRKLAFLQWWMCLTVVFFEGVILGSSRWFVPESLFIDQHILPAPLPFAALCAHML